MTNTNASAEIHQLFLADREEHANVPSAGTEDYSALRERDRERRTRALRERDRERRTRALRCINTIETPTAEDYYRVAWLFNHGDTANEAQHAYELALKAKQMGHEAARWLSAAAYDRWQMYSSKPQKYGTQIVPDGMRYRVWDTDPETTDQQRAEYDVPSLAEQQQRAEKLTETESQPPMDSAPQWLKDAIPRWQTEEMHSHLSSTYNQVALVFAQHLATARFNEAHTMLCKQLQNEYLAETLAERYTKMIAYGDSTVSSVEMVSMLNDWPQRQLDDVGWTYIAISGEGFSEAVTLIVSKENERAVIRTIEWGRP